MRRVFKIIVPLAMIQASGCSPLGDQLAIKNTGFGEKPSIIPVSHRSGLAQRDLLDRTTLNIVRSYGSTIRNHSDKYGFDWRFILAVIRCESGFDVNAESPKGAAGLMQLMPATSREVGEKLEIDVMAHPSSNIHGGVYYLKKLYDMFEGSDPSDRLRLALAAYNAGLGRVYDAQDVAAYLHEDPSTWESVRNALPLLSKRYYTLHKNVWEGAKPRVGWFGNSKETVAYVDQIMELYDEYQLVLN